MTNPPRIVLDDGSDEEPRATRGPGRRPQEPAVIAGSRLLSTWLTSRRLGFQGAAGMFSTRVAINASTTTAGEPADVPGGEGALGDPDGSRWVELRLGVADGPKPSLFFVVSDQVAVPRDAWARALVLANGWNATMPVPRARLAVGDWATEAAAPFVLDAWLPLVPGLPQSLVSATADAVMDGTARFFRQPAGGALAEPAAPGEPV